MDESENLLEHFRSIGNPPDEPTAEALAKREVAAELRAFVHAIGTSRASAEQMRELAAQLRAQSDVLLGARQSSDARSDSPAALAGMEDFLDRSPIMGYANPIAPPAALAPDLEARVVRGEVNFGPAFEGAPGCVHGGFVAAVLDEALGMACVFSGSHAMTGGLTTRYRHHTPVSTLLRVEARLVSVEGRKIRTAGEVYHGDLAVAEGHGLFIAVDTAKFEQLVAAKSERFET
ncbi:MAG: PaaI family thioesterase [Deltaproteobacteria bacterium]|nr:MAG: PaaI family thioesterase [Deltaproteobacteria bacterium]